VCVIVRVIVCEREREWREMMKNVFLV